MPLRPHVPVLVRGAGKFVKNYVARRRERLD
jgi:hypothetical protein